MISKVLYYSNSKLRQFLISNKHVSGTYLNEFTFEEIQAFVGLMILTGVFRVNREPLSKLYCKDPNFSRLIFKATLPRERFKTILRFLRFDDFETRLSRISEDKLAPIREILDHIKYTLNTSYFPHTFLTIDEHMCAYRGRCSFRQFIPSKPDKYGIKIFILADSTTYYPYNIEVYSGKLYLSNKPADIVLRLVATCRPGHVVVGDNYFTSLSLCNSLVDRYQIRYFGTLRCNRREVPSEMKNTKNKPLYSSRFVYHKDTTMVSYIAKKNKSVLLLSNYHHDGSISDTYKQKPQLILDYNRHKCGVDVLDQLLKGHRPYRATRRWPCVLFFDLIGLSSHASYVLYTSKFVDSHIARKKQRREYLYMLGIELVLPQIVKRRKSSSFRYLTKEVRSYIDDLLKSKCGSQDVSVVTPEITPVHCSSIPESSAVPVSFPAPESIPALESSVAPESYECVTSLPQIEFSRPTVISRPDLQGVTQTIVDTNSISDLILPYDVPQTSRGRCTSCLRQKDVKLKSFCNICSKHVCVNHSTRITVCRNCEDKKVSID